MTSKSSSSSRVKRGWRRRNQAEEDKAYPRRTPLLADIRKNPQLYILMLPFFLLFSLMVLIPIVASVALSFTYYNMFQMPEWLGLDNYVNLFVNDEVFLIALKNTLIFAIVTGPLSYLVCFCIAWFINELSTRARVILTFIFYAPSLSSSVYFIWQFLFSGDTYGFINGCLLNIGLISEPVQWLNDPSYNLIVLMIVQLWMSLGTGFLAFIAGLKSVDTALYEVGYIDGVSNRWQELLYITIPMMKPQLFFGAIMQISASFSVSTISMQLCGFPSTNYSAHTILLHIYDYGTLRYEMGYACAIAVVLFVLMLLVKKAVNLLMRYIDDE